MPIGQVIEDSAYGIVDRSRRQPLEAHIVANSESKVGATTILFNIEVAAGSGGRAKESPVFNYACFV